MKKIIVFSVVGLALCVAIVSLTGRGQASQVRPQTGFGEVPLYFIANQGQADPEARFYAKTPGYTLWLTRQGLRFDQTGMTFPGARSDVEVTASDPTDYIVSYFYGRDELDWHTGIPTSKAVLYKGLYEGIDLKLYGAGKVVEYDWIVKAGADPTLIRFGYTADMVTRLDGNGNLVVETDKGEIQHRKPTAYQVIRGRKADVAVNFIPISDGVYGFKLGPYDRNCELVIDPLVLVFSSFLGGRDYDEADSVAVDASGAVYVAGYTDSMDFPPVRAQFPRGDAFITKFSPDGKQLVYSAFFPVGFGMILRNNAGNQGAFATAGSAGRGALNSFLIFIKSEGGGAGRFTVDPSGAAFLVGSTSSEHFPVKNAYQDTYGGGWQDGFFLKLAPNGKSLIFSSYYGGTGEEALSAVALDSQGTIYLGGGVSTFGFVVDRPRNKSAIGGSGDIFISKFEPNGKNKTYSKEFGLSGWMNYVADLAVDSAGAVYAVGQTGALNFPLKNAIQKKFGGGWMDAFIVKLAPAGDSFVYASYLGGPNMDTGVGVAVDGKGAAYLTGYTFGNFPLKNAFRKARKGSIDAFLAKIAPDGKDFVYSTYLGGEGWDTPSDLAVDAEGRAYVAGETYSQYFPVKDAYKSVRTGTTDGFLTVFTPDGRSLVLSTFFGGSYSDAISGLAIDGKGGIYLAGYTNSRDIPLLNPYQAGYAGGYWDGFVTKLK